MTVKTFKLSDKPAGITIVAGIDVHKHKLQVFVLGRIDASVHLHSGTPDLCVSYPEVLDDW